MGKKNGLLTAAAIMLILSAAIGSAWSYFTTYTEARGGYTVRLGDETTIDEEFSDWTKKVSIASEEGAEPVYIRAKAFCGNEFQLIYSDESGKWTLGDEGWYYYSDILYGGETADTLLVKIENIPEEVKDSDSFNVVVVYESTPVLYNEDGEPYADWSVKLESDKVEGGAD